MSDPSAAEILEADFQAATSTEIVPSAAREVMTDTDGWVIDAETGEILGRSDLSDRFEVNSDDAADWALELRSRLEADLLAVDARLRAVQEMLGAIKRERMRRLSWWEWRFRPSLEAYARTKLTKKVRTAMFTWGKVAFRTTAGSHEILDMERAVAWVRMWAPKRVKVVETVGIKDVMAAAEIAEKATGEKAELPNWLKASGETESVKIETGVEMKLKGPSK